MPRQPDTRFRRLIRHPLARIVIVLGFVAPVIVFNNVISLFVVERMGEPLKSLMQIPKAFVLLVLLAMVYRSYTRRIEKRGAIELGGDRWYLEFGAGWLMGGGMVASIVCALSLLGSFRIVSFNDPLLLVTSFFRYGQGSFVEELLFTVVLFRLIEEFVGTPASYLTVSLLFGLLHLGNDNATIGTSLFITIQEITLLAPFILTRRLWMSWAVHFSWNYSQTAVFGMNNSGMAHGGFINPEVGGPELLTGGSFGIEASVLGMLVNLAIGLPLLAAAWRYGQLVAPRWRRNQESPL